MSVRALFVVGRNRGVADRDDKRARKARTAVVRGVGRAAFDVHVVTAVNAIPLKSVLLVVLNGEIRAILQVGLIVVAEIDGMNVASAGAIHGKRSVIERERGILVCAHRHPTHSAVYGVEPMSAMLALMSFSTSACSQRAIPLSVNFKAWPLPSIVRSLLRLRPAVSASTRS